MRKPSDASSVMATGAEVGTTLWHAAPTVVSALRTLTFHTPEPAPVPGMVNAFDAFGHVSSWYQKPRSPVGVVIGPTAMPAMRSAIATKSVQQKDARAFMTAL